MENRVSDESVKKLIEVTVDNVEIVHKYYKWKSEIMNETLTPADIYAPLSKNSRKYTFEEAKEIVLNAYFEFDEKVGEIVKDFFEEKRIHSEISKGKMGGAFCSYYTPTIKPFVLVNFMGHMNDVMTLAHELGHGLHGTLSSKQTYLNYHTPLTMAELASVFGEFLVFEKLKNQLKGEEKRFFIASKLEEIFATMFRQNMFVRFEIEAHNLISKQGMATWDELSDIYEKELNLMFGDSVKITPEYKFEWATIPHIFHTPFYVYAYNYANCLVISLYEKYLGKPLSHVSHEVLHTTYKNRKRIKNGDIEILPLPIEEDEKTTVKVCLGTSCYSKGSYDILSNLIDVVNKEEWGQNVEIKGTFCVENCGKSPNVVINDTIISEATTEKIKEVLEKNVKSTKRK